MPPEPTEYEAEAVPEFKEKPASKPRWQTRLNLKSPQTVRNYKPHIVSFIDSRGKSTVFVQADIDAYFAQIKRIDDRKPENERESKSKKE